MLSLNVRHYSYLLVNALLCVNLEIFNDCVTVHLNVVSLQLLVTFTLHFSHLAGPFVESNLQRETQSSHYSIEKNCELNTSLPS